MRPKDKELDTHEGTAIEDVFLAQDSSDQGNQEIAAVGIDQGGPLDGIHGNRFFKKKYIDQKQDMHHYRGEDCQQESLHLVHGK